jgi:hypothetical protein
MTLGGKARARVFDCDQDRKVFLDLPASYSQQYGLLPREGTHRI